MTKEAIHDAMSLASEMSHELVFSNIEYENTG